MNLFGFHTDQTKSSGAQDYLVPAQEGTEWIVWERKIPLCKCRKQEDAERIIKALTWFTQDHTP
jgi:hypothetical protein